MPFGMVSEVGRGTGVLDGWLSSKGKEQFRGELGASHCNQWEHCCIVVRERRTLLKLLPGLVIKCYEYILLEKQLIRAKST